MFGARHDDVCDLIDGARRDRDAVEGIGKELSTIPWIVSSLLRTEKTLKVFFPHGKNKLIVFSARKKQVKCFFRAEKLSQ